MNPRPTLVKEGGFESNLPRGTDDSRYHVGILGLQPRDKATMLGVNTIELFSREIYLKMEVTSQRRGMVFFLITNMPAEMPPANQQYKESRFNVSKNKSLRMLPSFY